MLSASSGLLHRHKLILIHTIRLGRKYLFGQVYLEACDVRTMNDVSRKGADSAKHTSLSLVCTIRMEAASDSHAVFVSSASLRAKKHVSVRFVPFVGDKENHDGNKQPA